MEAVERPLRSEKGNEPFSVTVQFICKRELGLKTNHFDILCTLFSKETLLLVLNHHSVSLETEKWHEETYRASVVHNNPDTTGGSPALICH